MRLALDTNRYIDFCRGDDSVVTAVRLAREIVLPFVTLAELRAGFACGTRATRNASVLTRFLGRPRVRALFADDGTTHHYANLFRQLRRQGTPIPTNDLWIAALCTQHDLLLASRDTHFDHLPQLPRV
jgi:tRNA(fMet)-specific endonuclease VapC